MLFKFDDEVDFKNRGRIILIIAKTSDMVQGRKFSLEIIHARSHPRMELFRSRFKKESFGNKNNFQMTIINPEPIK